MKSPLISTRFVGSLVVSALTLFSVDSFGQTVLQKLPRPDTSRPVTEEVKEKLNTVKDVGGNLQEKINIANERLSEISSGDSDAMVEEINKTFTDFRNEIHLIIDQTGINSDLQDALGKAREQAIIFRADLASKPADYPNRDDRLAQLDVMLAEYETLKTQLSNGGKEARQKLFKLSQQQGQIVEQIKFEQIVKAQEALRDVVAGLSVLADSIANLQQPRLDATAVQN